MFRRADGPPFPDVSPWISLKITTQTYTAEDAFTGSATGRMAAYLWHYGLIKKPMFIAEQGHRMGRAESASVEVVGDPKDIETVKVGGKAVVVMKGEIEI